MIRSTPWVDGCCGPMLMIIVWDSPSSSGDQTNLTNQTDLSWRVRTGVIVQKIDLGAELSKESGHVA